MNTTQPGKSLDIDTPGDRRDRRTTIPTPRSNAMFSGWGVRF